MGGEASVTDSINDKGVCRRAPATPGLLKIVCNSYRYSTHSYSKARCTKNQCCKMNGEKETLLHNAKIYEVLSGLVFFCRETKLQDVTLSCEDCQMSSLRALIALVYPILEDVLKDSDEEDLILILPDFSKTEIDQRIHFCLDGKTENYTPNVKTESNQMEYKPDIKNQEMSTKSNHTYIELVTIDTDRSYKSRDLLTCLMCGQQFLEILIASGVKN